MQPLGIKADTIYESTICYMSVTLLADACSRCDSICNHTMPMMHLMTCTVDMTKHIQSHLASNTPYDGLRNIKGNSHMSCMYCVNMA